MISLAKVENKARTRPFKLRSPQIIITCMANGYVSLCQLIEAKKSGRSALGKDCNYVCVRVYTAVNSKYSLTNHALKGNCHKIFVNRFSRNLDYPRRAIKLIFKTQSKPPVPMAIGVKGQNI